MVDWESAFQIAIAAVSAVLGWLLRVLWEAQKALQADLAALERRLPETYARRDDISALSERIDRRFDHLESLLMKRDRL
jgi:cell division protein FtsB